LDLNLDEALSSIEACTTLDELRSFLQKVAENYGFSAFNFLDAGQPHHDQPFYIGTVKEAWEQDYARNNFVVVDPCVQKVRKTNTPFTWGSIPLPKYAGRRKPGAMQRAVDLIAEQQRRGVSIIRPNQNSTSVTLTDRERDMLAWAARGKTVADTADILKISEETVETHIRNAMRKLDATNKTHAVAKAIYLSLIDV
jgi:DNA-binding CsgD family transcriptional regulator